MKIGITGSHGSGKTCLASGAVELVIKTGGSVTLIPEVARRVIALGLPLNEDARLESYYRYVQLQLESERLATTTDVISDRTLVDLLAYVEVNNDRRIPGGFVDMLREIVRREAAYYDLHCYLPLEFELEVDGVRSADRLYQSAVDSRILEIIQRFGLPFVTIRGPLARRCEALSQIVRDVSRSDDE